MIDPTLPLHATRWSSERAEDRFVVDNPATGAPLAAVQGGGAGEVDAAVRAAQAGFEVWRRRPAAERGRLLIEAARVLRAHADELARLETQEMGKPLAQARYMDMEACIGSFEFFGALIGRLPENAVDTGPILSVEHLTPYGVVAGVIPFNWPPIHFGGKVAPALAVGNAIVLKPGEQAPLTVMRLAELVASVLPDDVIHVVPGGGATGAALVGHPLVRKISFTGAPETGARVLKTAADNLTPALMELGGKNALIVCADADLDIAIAGALEGAFINQGEACTAASRLLVARDIHDEFVARMAAAVRRLRVGDGLELSTHVGPLVDRRQQQRVLSYIGIGQSEGAMIAAQAELPDDARLRDGFFAPPTLFTGVTPQMRVAQEEIFGPVTCVIAFDNEDEAIAIANGTAFGLVAGLYARDALTCARIADRLEAGVVMVNNYNRNFMGTPFGGVKASGFGREHCAETLREFGYIKAVRTPTGRMPIMKWPALNELLG